MNAYQLRETYGFSLIPVGSNKRPPIEWAEYQSTQCDEHDITRWKRQYHGFAVVTGKLSNLVVVDLDNAEAIEWAEHHLPTTPWRVLSGDKGGTRGQHWYYRFPHGIDTRNKQDLATQFEDLPHGIDIRGEGGYVVAPGTRHESGVTYDTIGYWDPSQEPPTFSWEWFGRRKEINRPKPSPNLPKATNALEKAQKWLDAQPIPHPGHRNSTVYNACCACFHLHCTESEVEHLMANWTAPFLSQTFKWSEVLQCIRSASSVPPSPDSYEPVNTCEPPPSKTLPQPQEGSEQAEGPAARQNPPSSEDPAPPDRTFVERNYLLSWWNSEQGSEQLGAHSVEKWKDPACRAAIEAIQSLMTRAEVLEPIAIAQEMLSLGYYPYYEGLALYEESLTEAGKLRRESSSAKAAFIDATRWDHLKSLWEEFSPQVGRGRPQEFLARIHERTGDLLAQQTTKQVKTVKQVCEEVLRGISEGEQPKERIHIPIFSDAIGPAGGGDVIPYCGPPKTGKSFLMRTLREKLSLEGIPTLTGQLELRLDQVVQREVAAQTGLAEIDEFTAKRLLKENSFAHLDNAYITTTGYSIETYKAEVYEILSAHPEIKVWLTDYNERLYQYGNGKGVDQNMQAAAVAKFIKDTAKRFDVVAIILLQPNGNYEKFGHHGPTEDHIDYGKQWRKDAHALGFLHKPAKFDKAQPSNLVQLVWLNARSAPPKTIDLEFCPEVSTFNSWTGHAHYDRAANDFRSKAASSKYEELDELDIDL